MWIMSKRLCESSRYSPAQAEASSPDAILVGELSAQWSSIGTAKRSWSRDKTTGVLSHSPSGMTFGLSTESHGEALLMSFRAGFRVRTSPRLAAAKALMAPAPDSGRRWPELSVRFDLESRSWRTHQTLFPEDLPECSVILPRSGMMRRGVCSERSQLAHGIDESGCGFLLPTLTKCGNYNRKGLTKQSGDGLHTALCMMPTLTRSDAKRGGGRRARARSQGPNLSESIGGHPGPLNPTWCEWFMGWPMGWTELKRSATARFRSAQLKHFDC
jgi:hypothetical protein